MWLKSNRFTYAKIARARAHGSARTHKLQVDCSGHRPGSGCVVIMKLLKIINPENVYEEDASDWRHRKAVRAVVFDDKNRIGLLYVKSKNYYKLPGGGMEDGENIKTALERECDEELGIKIEMINEIGSIIEFHAKFRVHQTSYCYLARVISNKSAPHFTDEEKSSGFETIWVNPDEALRLLNLKQTSDYHGKCIEERDLCFLKENLRKNEKTCWSKYVKKTKNHPPRALLVQAVSFVSEKNHALDLGAGALTDTKYLVNQGFNHVTAVDHENLAQEEYNKLPQEKVDYVITTFGQFAYSTTTFNLVNAQFALPFNPPETFAETFQKIKHSLKPGGIFVGQLFGERDEWNKARRRMSFFTRAQVDALLSDMEVLEITEEEKDQRPVVGKVKHWHIFHIIARKK